MKEFSDKFIESIAIPRLPNSMDDNIRIKYKLEHVLGFRQNGSTYKGEFKGKDIFVRAVKVYVLMNIGWSDAVNSIGKQDSKCSDIFKASKLYPVVGSAVKIVEETIILVKFFSARGHDIWNKAHDFARTNGLKNTSPREIFAIGGQYPMITIPLEQSPVNLVATGSCTLGSFECTCYVQYNTFLGTGIQCEARMCFVEDIILNDGEQYEWFAFRKP